MARRSAHEDLHEDLRRLPTSLGAERDYYGAVIREATLGPRREITLRIELWLQGQSTGGGSLVTLRFGAIKNFAEVQQFFAAVPMETLHHLRHVSQPRRRHHVVEMEFDRSGERIWIVAGSIVEPLGADQPGP
jgi:hypothetical protein